jgi:hypothetical protein
MLAGDKWKRDDSYGARLDAFYGETENRPKFVWVNREDIFYHDTEYPLNVAAAPEYCAFPKKPWVFNRGMEWVRRDGIIVGYESAGILPLTGEKRVSAWFTGPDNRLGDEAEYTRFEKHSNRRRDGVVLPAFQFHLGQHPVLELDAAGTSSDWQFCVSLKGHSGPPLFSTPWHNDPVSAQIDLDTEMAPRGFDWNYPELHFVIGTWHEDHPGHTSAIRFRLRMLPRASVVGCLPVIRASTRAAEGVAIAAVAVDAEGRRLGKEHVRVQAAIGETKTPLDEAGQLWQGRLKGLPEGEHTVRLISEGAVQPEGRTEIRITDGRFYGFDRNLRWVTQGGKPVGPISGSDQGTFFFRNAGERGERMVQGQREWDGWDRSQPDSEHMHFWESLTPGELDERFHFLRQCGYDLLALHSHWGNWE